MLNIKAAKLPKTRKNCLQTSDSILEALLMFN